MIRLDGANSFRCAGEDEITGLQGEDFADLRDELRRFENHVTRVAPLPLLAVHLAKELQVRWIGHLLDNVKDPKSLSAKKKEITFCYPFFTYLVSPEACFMNRTFAYSTDIMQAIQASKQASKQASRQAGRQASNPNMFEPNRGPLSCLSMNFPTGVKWSLVKSRRRPKGEAGEILNES